jgi:hypothetical protein
MVSLSTPFYLLYQQAQLVVRLQAFETKTQTVFLQQGLAMHPVHSMSA